MNKLFSKKGFSMIELMTTVAIVGISSLLFMEVHRTREALFASPIPDVLLNMEVHRIRLAVFKNHMYFLP